MFGLLRAGLAVLAADLGRAAVVVDFSLPIVPVNRTHGVRSCAVVVFLPECVHVGVKENLGEGDQKSKNEPNVNHFDVRSCRQTVAHLK